MKKVKYTVWFDDHILGTTSFLVVWACDPDDAVAGFNMLAVATRGTVRRVTTQQPPACCGECERSAPPETEPVNDLENAEWWKRGEDNPLGEPG